MVMVKNVHIPKTLVGAPLVEAATSRSCFNIGHVLAALGSLGPTEEDVEPDNILVDGPTEDPDSAPKVRLIDLENATHLPGPRYIQGMLAGNEIWRSPEALSKGKLNKPTDIFSFGLVMSQFVLWTVRNVDPGSASTQCSAFVMQTKTSRSMKLEAHIHLLFGYNVCWRITAAQALQHPWFIRGDEGSPKGRSQQTGGLGRSARADLFETSYGDAPGLGRRHGRDDGRSSYEQMSDGLMPKQARYRRRGEKRKEE